MKREGGFVADMFRRSGKTLKPFYLIFFTFLISLSFFIYCVCHLRFRSYSVDYVIKKLGSFTFEPQSFTEVDERFQMLSKGVHLRSGYKTILLWNSFFDVPEWDYAVGIGTKFFEESCLVKTCQDMPRRSSPRQRWIFNLLESPVHTYNYLPSYDGVFNWTMTYRRDSDISMPYGRVARRKQPLKQPPEPPKTKSRLVALLSGNCDVSHRGSYQSALAQFIPIDTYGRCTGLRCNYTSPGKVMTWSGRSIVDFWHDCLPKFQREYFFYLAMENSFCEDYVTEKVFRNALHNDVVPVVMGGANYKEILPPHSFIDAGNFSSPKKLADYLLHLMKNPKEYKKYFEWKQFYQIESVAYEALRRPFCDLCEKLHNSTEPAKIYHNISAFWSPARQCYGAWHFAEHSFSRPVLLSTLLKNYTKEIVWFFVWSLVIHGAYHLTRRCCCHTRQRSRSAWPMMSLRRFAYRS